MSNRLDEALYKVDWIACENLSVVWVQAQRPLNERRAREIAANFDPDLFDPLKVTLPNGNGIYHVCNGQHRKRAVESLYGPKEKVPCHVAPDGDPVRAALLFLRTNTGQRPPNKIDHFKVSVTAELPTEVAIDRIVRSNSYRVDAAASEDAISAVGALYFVFNTCGPSMLDLTLKIVRSVWDNDRNAVSGLIIRGFGVFLNEYGSYVDRSRLIDIVKRKWTPGTLIREAKADSHVRRVTTNDAIVGFLLEHYNKNLPKNLTSLVRKKKVH